MTAMHTKAIDRMIEYMVTHLLGALAPPRERETKPTGRPAKTGWIPTPGFAWNPLRDFPVNSPCFCGSERKFKRCCRDYLHEGIEKDKAKWLLDHWEHVIAGRVRFPEAPRKTWQT